MLKLNVGCGPKYMEGYVNIDGNMLLRADKYIDLNADSLLNHFDLGSVDLIVANQIMEHFFHWEAITLLKDFQLLLKDGGVCEINLPDAQWIIEYEEWPIENKLTYLYGGQDVSQGKNSSMNEHRKKYPQHFCHKYGWSEERVKKEWTKIFSEVEVERRKPNLIITVVK